MTVEEAVTLLAEGGVVGVPTETVYGIAADPRDEAAVGRLFDLKGRDRAKPIALLGHEVEAFDRLARLDGMATAMGRRHWPGPLTLVVPMRKALAEGVGDPERGTVGIRVPDHPVALELLALTGKKSARRKKANTRSKTTARQKKGPATKSKARQPKQRRS